MRNVHTTVNEYYNTFESHNGVITSKSKRLWLFILVLTLSVIAMLSMIDLLDFEWYPDNRKTKFIICVTSFIGTMVCWFMVLVERESVVIRRCQILLNTEEKSLQALKVMWLKKYLPYKPSQYLELAEKVDKVVSLREKYKEINGFSFKEISAYIFTRESKPRLLAMFLMLCATVATLSVKEGATLTSIFEFYGSAKKEELLTIFIYTPVILLIGYIEVKFSILALGRLIERVLERLNGKHAYSIRRTRIFINALLVSFSFEKPKLKLTIVNTEALEGFGKNTEYLHKN